MIEKIFWQDHRLQIRIVQTLQSGNIALGSSDTVLGLLSDVTEQGVSLLNEIKGREKKPYIILIESKQKALNFIEEKEIDTYQKLIDSCWPGPLTLIFKAKDDLPDYVKGKDGTVALRVPKHDGLLAVLRHFKGLFSTSANLAGQPVPKEIEQVDPELLKQVSLIVDDNQKNSNLALPSTILDLTGPVVKMIRQGAYSKEELEKLGRLKIC